MTRTVELLVKAVAPVIVEYVANQLKPLRARLEEFEQRLRDAEKKSVTFRGIWEPGRAYGTGSAVTHRGSLWISHCATVARPGDPDEASRAWTLAVKKGTL